MLDGSKALPGISKKLQAYVKKITSANADKLAKQTETSTRNKLYGRSMNEQRRNFSSTRSAMGDQPIHGIFKKNKYVLTASRGVALST